MMVVIAALAGTIYNVPDIVTGLMRFFRTPPAERESRTLIRLLIYLAVAFLNFTLALYYWTYVREHT